MNITEESNKQEQKSRFQKLVDKVDPQTRIQMVQQGLNPFNEEDIATFYNKVKNGDKLSWGQRFTAAWSFLWSKKINNDLLIAVLKKVNDSQEVEPSYESLVNTTAQPDPITEKLMNRPPHGRSTAAKFYEKELKDALVSRITTAVEKGEMPQQKPFTEGSTKSQTKPFKNTPPPAAPAPMVQKVKKKKKFYKSPNNTKKPKK